MTPWIAWLLATTVMCWLLLLGASLLHAEAWTVPGLQRAFGNRGDLPEPTPLVARTKRAAANLAENMPLLLAVLLAAVAAHGSVDRMNLGTAVFFWSRVVHAIFYIGGVPYLRTAAWCVSLLALVLVASGIPWS
jgi:uncharacterized MAPEG superfamily protein